MKRSHIGFCVFLIVMAAIAIATKYADLPAAVPVHWNFNGRPDGYGPRAMVWLLGPGLMGIMLVIGLGLPWLSPRRFELAPFTATYSYFIVVIVAALGLFQAAVVHEMPTGSLDMHRTIYVGGFMLLILLGNPMGKVKRNFYVGIRTPWSLTNDRVWHATHRLGARLMVGSGFLGLIAVFAGAGPWVLVPLAGGWAVIIAMFSLAYYKHLKKNGQLEAG